MFTQLSDHPNSQQLVYYRIREHNNQEHNNPTDKINGCYIYGVPVLIL